MGCSVSKGDEVLSPVERKPNRNPLAGKPSAADKNEGPHEGHATRMQDDVAEEALSDISEGSFNSSLFEVGGPAGGGGRSRSRADSARRSGAGGRQPSRHGFDGGSEENANMEDLEFFVYDDVRIPNPQQNAHRIMMNRSRHFTKTALPLHDFDGSESAAGGLTATSSSSTTTTARSGAEGGVVAVGGQVSPPRPSTPRDRREQKVFFFNDFAHRVIDELDVVRGDGADAESGIEVGGGGRGTGFMNSCKAMPSEGSTTFGGGGVAVGQAGMSASSSIFAPFDPSLGAGGSAPSASFSSSQRQSASPTTAHTPHAASTSGATNASVSSSSDTGILGFAPPAITAALIRSASTSAIGSSPSVTLANGTICRATNVGNTRSKQRFVEAQARAVQARGHASVHSFTVQQHIGHAYRVKCIAIAPGDNEFVSCSNEDSVVTLVSVRSGQEVSNFAGHQDTVISATFSPDGKYLATTSRDNTMILWDVVTAKQILQFDHAKVVICCTFSRDSRFVATGCQDKVCRLWETRRGRETVFFPDHDGIIICMSYSPDNCYIASASADKTVRVWATQSGKARSVLRGHSGIVLSCAYTNDGLHIISNDEKTVRVWDANSGNAVRTIAVEDFVMGGGGSGISPTLLSSKKLTWTLSCVAPGLFHKFILVACNNRFVYVIDITTGMEVTSFFCKAPVYCLSSGYANMAAFGDSFGNLYLAQMH